MLQCYTARRAVVIFRIISLRTGTWLAQFAADDVFASHFTSQCRRTDARSILKNQVGAIRIAAMEITPFRGIFNQVELVVVAAPVEDGNYPQRLAKGAFQCCHVSACPFILIRELCRIKRIGAVVFVVVAQLHVQICVFACIPACLPEQVMHPVVAVRNISVGRLVACRKAVSRPPDLSRSTYIASPQVMHPCLRIGIYACVDFFFCDDIDPSGKSA